MRSICVFCGSSPGFDPRYLASARALGSVLADAGIELVYGGASVGLMGALADAVLAGGGRVTGVIPQALVAHEVAHGGLDALHVVPTMHERKALMASLADAFVALPGGLGTLEELFEVLTWAQLGFHDRPCAVLDDSGFYDPLFELLDHTVGAGLMKPAHRALLIAAQTPADLLDRLHAHVPQTVSKWIAPPPADRG